MSDPDDGNKTVFRPSPLAARKSGGTLPPAYAGAVPPVASAAAAPVGEEKGTTAVPPTPLSRPAGGLAGAAAPALALAIAMRSSGDGTQLPQLHALTGAAMGRFNTAIGAYPEAIRQRATYAVSATIDDVAQNVSGAGNDGVEWARRSMVAQFSGADIDADRFNQIVEEALRDPGQNRELVELLKDCVTAGFEGPYRGAPDALGALAAKLKNAPAQAAAAAAAAAATTAAMPATAPAAPLAPVPQAPVWTPSSKPSASGAAPAAIAAPAPVPKTVVKPAPPRKKRTGRVVLIGVVVIVLLLAMAYLGARLWLPPGTLSVGALHLSQVDGAGTGPADLVGRTLARG